MFTPKTLRPLAALLLAAALVGCEKPLDSPEYGELINQVPPKLAQPFPLPELDPPTSDPLAGPPPVEGASGEAPTEPAAAEKPANIEQNPE